MFSYNEIKVFYKRHLGSGSPVLFLHGWGGNSASFSGAYDYLCSLGRDVVAVDFPGFGNSDMPLGNWGIDDYASCIEALVESMELNKVMLVGHSFGGRVAICLGNRKWVDRIILVDSAGLKPRFSLSKKIKVLRYKLAKKAGKDLSAYGSADYRTLNPQMKSVFINVVNAFLDDRLESINCPVLIVWGKHDKETPVYMARRLKRKLKNRKLIYLDGGHFAYAEDMIKFNYLLTEFSGGGEECNFGQR